MDLATAKIKTLVAEVDISGNPQLRRTSMISSAKTFVRYTPVESEAAVPLMLENVRLETTAKHEVTLFKISFLINYKKK